MYRWIRSLTALLLALATTCAAVAQAAKPDIVARSYVLYDVQSKQLIAAENADLRVDPASLTKLMTAYLTFASLKQKKLTGEQTVPISERAWKAEGSRMFVEPKRPVTVDELLRGMIIQSGNDASIALAEVQGGSEDLFAVMMNKEAKRLGLTNTNFTNATGLPDKAHYATARDLATLANAIVRDFPEYFPIYKQRDYTYNNIKQDNRNRLLWLDPTVDGMKTGHTEAAGYCLVSTAKRGERRLISVVVGTASDSARTIESQKLLNFGFQFYDTRRVFAKNQLVKDVPVFKGGDKLVAAGFTQDVFLTLPKDKFDTLRSTLSAPQYLVAPISAGQQIGVLKFTSDNAVIAEMPVVALAAVKEAGIFGRLWDSMRLWFE